MSDELPANPWADQPVSSAPSNPWQDGLPFALTENDATPPPIEPGRVDALDFWDAIKQNRRNTFILIFCMLMLAAAFGYVLGWAWDVSTGNLIGGLIGYTRIRDLPWGQMVLALSPAGLKVGGALLAGMVIWSVYALARADKMVLSMAEAKEVPYDRLPQLHNVVEELAIAAGLPKPKVYLIATRMPNAFATGLTPETACVGITTGLLERLDRRELQGVIAHEMGHVLNDDMRYATIMTVMTGVLIFVAQIILNTRRFFYYNGNSSRRGRGGNGLLAVLMVVVFLVTAILVPILAQIIQMAISRQREYLADATAVRLTRDPQGLISALQKIAASNEPAPKPNAALEPLFFMTPSQMLQNGHRVWFSTHPPVEKRIERLKALE